MLLLKLVRGRIENHRHDKGQPNKYTSKKNWHTINPNGTKEMRIQHQGKKKKKQQELCKRHGPQLNTSMNLDNAVVHSDTMDMTYVHLIRTRSQTHNYSGITVSCTSFYNNRLIR